LSLVGRGLEGLSAPPSAGSGGSILAVATGALAVLPFPEIERQQRQGKQAAFRADAAFAKPEIYQALEERGVKYAIRLPATSATAMSDHGLDVGFGRDFAFLEEPCGVTWWSCNSCTNSLRSCSISFASEPQEQIIYLIHSKTVETFLTEIIVLGFRLLRECERNWSWLRQPGR
jgi:hypothetical protein